MKTIALLLCPGTEKLRALLFLLVSLSFSVFVVEEEENTRFKVRKAKEKTADYKPINLFNLHFLPPIMNITSSATLFYTAVCIITTSVCALSSIPSQNSQTTGTLSQRGTNSIFIRTTKSDDLATIVDLLAFEKANEGEDSQPNIFNWNRGINKLKSKQSLNLQLTHRLDAILAANTFRNSLSIEEYKDMPIQNILWNNDSFRNKVEKAVKTTKEYNEYKSQWDDHNFALTPDESMLHHFMITAVDPEFVGKENEAGTVGFCEVGILLSPHDGFVPCIGNLVVSPNQRRRGVGRRLMECASRLIRVYSARITSNSDDDDGEDEQGFNSSIVGLYVDDGNQDAIRLYEKMGFEVSGKCNDVKGRVFMQLDIRESGETASNSGMQSQSDASLIGS